MEIALQAKLVGGELVVVWSAQFTFSDYGMELPRAPVVLSVDDHGKIEFQLFFWKANA